MTLWIIFAGLTAAALAAVLWPLISGKTKSARRDAFDAAVYRDQLAEIDADLDRSLIGPSEAEAARAEIARRLLATAGGDGEDPGIPRPGRMRAKAQTGLVGLIACAVPMLTLGLYLTYGAPGVPGEPHAARLKGPAGGQSVQTLVGRVEERLRKHPRDGRGWAVLAPVYMRMQRYDDAETAYAHVIRLLGETPGRLEDFAEAGVLANNGVITDNARQAFSKALKADPHRLKSRFWLAIADEQDGEFKKAEDAWRKMLAQGDENSKWRPLVKERLAAIEDKLSGKSANAASGETSGKTDTATAEPQRPSMPGPSAADMRSAGQMTPGQRQQMITTMVARLDNRLTTRGGSIDEWMRLVRAYAVLQRQDDATKALSEARDAYKSDQSALDRLSALAKQLGLES